MEFAHHCSSPPRQLKKSASSCHSLPVIPIPSFPRPSVPKIPKFWPLSFPLCALAKSKIEKKGGNGQGESSPWPFPPSMGALLLVPLTHSAVFPYFLHFLCCNSSPIPWPIILFFPLTLLAHSSSSNFPTPSKWLAASGALLTHTPRQKGKCRPPTIMAGPAHATFPDISPSPSPLPPAHSLFFCLFGENEICLLLGPHKL